MEALAVEFRQRDGIARHHGILPQTLRHELPVEIRADGKADGGPHGVGRTGEVGHARQAHEQPGPPRRQRREPRPHPAAAEEVLGRRRVRALRVHEPDGEHRDEIQEHREYDPKIVGNHRCLLPSSLCEMRELYDNGAGRSATNCGGGRSSPPPPRLMQDEGTWNEAYFSAFSGWPWSFCQRSQVE